MYRVGILASGGGTNLQAIIDAVERGDLPVVLAVIGSNRPNAFALERARRHGVPTFVVPMSRRMYPTREAHEEAIVPHLKAAQVDLVVLAGYDRIVSSKLLDAYPKRIINIHPALLPAFAGTLHAQQQALEYGVKVSGCTVHVVTAEVDCGPIVIQRAVEVAEDDTVDSLRARILAEEHEALPAAIKLFAEGRIIIEGRRVRVLPAR